MSALLSFGFALKLGLSCAVVGFSRKTDWRNLAIDFAFAVVSLTLYENLLGLAYFRDQTLLFIHSNWHVDLPASHFAFERTAGLPPGTLVQALGFVFFHGGGQPYQLLDAPRTACEPIPVAPAQAAP